jgi:glycogen debranching enzyme
VRARLRDLVEGFLPHLSEHGLGHVAEAFDGDAPHAPSGAPSDARAVASLLWASHLLGLATG